VRTFKSVAAAVCVFTFVGLAPAASRVGVLPARNLLVLPQTQTESSLALLWDKPVEAGNVAGYEVYQDGALVATTAANQTFYGATNLAPGRAYSFCVVAKGAGQERSEATATVREEDAVACYGRSVWPMR